MKLCKRKCIAEDGFPHWPLFVGKMQRSTIPVFICKEGQERSR